MVDGSATPTLRRKKIKSDRIEAEREFGKVVKNLHHLSSTKVQPGVYSNPFRKTKPKAFDIPIETHLKSAFK